MTTKKTMRLTVLLLTLCLLLSACGCSANSELRASSVADDTVATVGDYEIPYENLYFLAMNRIAELKAVYGDKVFEDPAKVEELKIFVAENLFGYTEAMILVARDYGISPEDDDIADRVQSDIDTMMTNQLEDSREAYIKMLNGRYMTDHYFRTYIAVSEYVTDAVLQKMLTSGEIDDSDDKARETIYNGDSFARVIQVFIDPQYYASDEAAKAKAESLRASVVAAEAGDARLDAMHAAKQHSLDTDTRDGLYIARGEMDEAFDSAAFSLELYGVSQVMYLNGGYCFLMRAPLDDGYVSQNFESLKQKSYYVYLNQKAEAYMSGATSEWTDFGAELDLLDLPPIEPDGGEWIDTLIAALIIGAFVIVIALLVKFLPDKDKKKAKKETAKKAQK